MFDKLKWWLLWHLSPGHDRKRLCLFNQAVAGEKKPPMLSAFAVPHDYQSIALWWMGVWDGEMYGAWIRLYRSELWRPPDEISKAASGYMAMLQQQACMTMDALADEAVGVPSRFPSGWLLALMEGEDYDEAHDIESTKAVMDLYEQQEESVPLADDSYWLARALQRQELHEQVFGEVNDGEEEGKEASGV